MPTRNLKVLMFGWEFPPHNSGGLGVACQELVLALRHQKIDIDFVLPRRVDCRSDGCNFLFADAPGGTLSVKPVDSILSPYQGKKSYKEMLRSILSGNPGTLSYGDDLMDEVMRYAAAAKKIVSDADFDVIHAHDWLSLPAGLAAKKISGKPLVFHVHATEYDRVGAEGADKRICDVEKLGLAACDRIIAVSEYTKQRVMQVYGAREEKIRVVPNAVNVRNFQANANLEPLKKQGAKIVLFVGRLTFQKGPDYFLRAAKIVSTVEKNVYFVVSGSGDMERWLIAESARLGIADRFVFTGFLRGNDLVRTYKMADLYVMPSVSDPFGLTALEAMSCGTPMLVSRQTGASQMLAHCLKVDFWDVELMASKIIALLRYGELGRSMAQNASKEVLKFDWEESARRCISVYREVLTA